MSDLVKWLKRQATEWEKIFSKNIFEKEPQLYKDSQN